MYKSQVQELEPNKVALLIEVGKDKVKEAFTSFFAAAAREAKVPGFRQGKVPRAVLEKHIGKSEVLEEIQQLLIRDAYPRAIQEHKLVPVSEAEISEAQLAEGQPFTFRATVELKPKLPEFAYRDLDVTVKQIKVSDEAVDKVIKNLQERYSKTRPVEDRGLQYGDYYLADISVFIDGTRIDELSKDRTYHKFQDEANNVLAPILGIRPGEERRFTKVLSDDAEKDSKYFGKTLEYVVKVERISAPTLPEINDEFAKEVGDYESVADLKKKIGEDLGKNFLEDAQGRALEALLKKISGAVEVRIPEAMIQRTIDMFIRRLEQRYRQFGASFKEYLEKTNQKIEDFRDAHRDKATEEAKVTLIMDAVGEREQMKVNDEEYRAEVERMAGEYHMPVEKMLATINERGIEEGIRDEVLDKKIREFLLKNNKVTFDMVNESELKKGDDQE